MQRLILLLGIVLTPWAEGQTKQPTHVLCKNKKTVRTIRTMPPKDGGNCSTIYTKQGLDKEVGAGKMYSSCLNILGNIKTNLEGAGWTCKDISASQVTSEANAQ